MDLSFPLTTVAPTLDAQVLQVLAARTQPCTAGEVHRLLGSGSNEGVRKVLARLTAQGIVIAHSAGRIRVYSFNREHLAAPYIEAITQLRGELIRRIEREIEAWEITPLHASIFGSFARGDAGPGSDVDLLVVKPGTLAGDDEDEWLHQLSALESSVQAWTGNSVQIVDMTSADLRAMVAADDPLVASWRDDVLPLCGKGMSAVLRRTA